MNQNEFISFYKSTFKKVFGYVYKRVNKLEDVEDIVSEGYTVLWNQKDDVTTNTANRYLFGILRNKINDYLRNKYKVSNLNISWDYFDEEISQPKTSKRLKGFESIEALVSSLNPKEQILFKLRYKENLSYLEIAKQLATTKNNAKVMHNRLIKKLKELWMNSL